MLFYVVIGKFPLFLATLIAVLLHELGHMYTAENRGYKMSKIVLMPYGAMMYGKENFNSSDSVRIALAGPITNILLLIPILACWWIFPPSYEFLEPFFYANISLAALNLLPCFPLDGARLILGVAKNKLKALKILKINGIVIGVVLIGLTIASYWHQFNMSLLNVGTLIIVGAISGTEKFKYNHILGAMSLAKNYNKGVFERTIYITAETPIYRLFRHISSEYLTTFIIVDCCGASIAVIDENDLYKIINQYQRKDLLSKVVEELNLT